MNKKYGIAIYTIIVLIFVFLTIDFYLSMEFYHPSSKMFLDNPAKYAGEQLVFVGPVLNVSNSSFYMAVDHRPLKVNYERLEKPKLGQIYILSIINSEGEVNALEVHSLSYNYIKYFISLFAFIVFLFIFFKEWRFKKWGFVENA